MKQLNLFSPKIIYTDYSHNDMVGRLGEILATYYLEVLGVRCEHVRTHGCDLWCETRDGLMLKCEVKSTTILQSKYDKEQPDRTRYQFFLNDFQKNNSDFHAFVALDRSMVLFYPNEDLPKCRSKSIGHTKFSNEAIEYSLSYTLKKVSENRKAA